MVAPGAGSSYQQLPEARSEGYKKLLKRLLKSPMILPLTYTCLSLHPRLKKRGTVLKKQGKAGKTTGAGKRSLKQLNSRVPVVLTVVQEVALTK